MTRKPASQRIPLDWSQLLGFDQLRRDAAMPPASVGAKVGVKNGRIGARVGVKVAPRR